MNEDNKVDVVGDFIKNLAEAFEEESSDKKLYRDYIKCCLNSIKQWNDTKYWDQINENSQKLLSLDINKLFIDYHIRSTSKESNEIYEKIYSSKKIKKGKVIADDSHVKSLWAALNYTSDEKKAKFTDEYFKDYRISHVWGCTKNIYLNNLPFNYFAIPSFCYCLSDKNNGGEIGKEFRLRLKKQVIKKCRESISSYNEKMNSLANGILKNLNDSIRPKKDEKRLSFIIEQFILIPNVISNKDEKEWNTRIEEGLKIFTYDFTNKKNIVEFSDEYIKAKEKDFKNYID